MAEVETNHDDDIISGNLSTFDNKDDLVVAHENQHDSCVDDVSAPTPTAPGVDIERSTNVLTTSSNRGVEEVNFPDNGKDRDEAIVDGFPAQTKPQVNVFATKTGATPEGFEELNTGIVEKPLNGRKDGVLRSPLAIWLTKQNLHPEMVRLIYWMEVARTTGVFGGVLLLLLSLRLYSFIGVVMTFALSLLVVAFLYRIGMTIVNAVQKTSAEHPFKHLLEEKIEISEESMEYWSGKTRQCINEGIRQTQCLFLVKDTVATLKAMVMFWMISYIASCIDLLTICTLATLLLFTVPILYEEKQSEIDQLYSLLKERTCLVWQVIEDKLPDKVRVYMKKIKSE